MGVKKEPESTINKDRDSRMAADVDNMLTLALPSPIKSAPDETDSEEPNKKSEDPPESMPNLDEFPNDDEEPGPSEEPEKEEQPTPKERLNLNCPKEEVNLNHLKAFYCPTILGNVFL